jgi:hypothetical protein
MRKFIIYIQIFNVFYEQNSGKIDANNKFIILIQSMKIYLPTFHREDSLKKRGAPKPKENPRRTRKKQRILRSPKNARKTISLNWYAAEMRIASTFNITLKQRRTSP